MRAHALELPWLFISSALGSIKKDSVRERPEPGISCEAEQRPVEGAKVVGNPLRIVVSRLGEHGHRARFAVAVVPTADALPCSECRRGPI